MLDRTPHLNPSRSPDSTLTIHLLAVRAGADAPPGGEGLPHLERLVQNRLGIIRRGLREASRQARCGKGEDAAVLVEKLEEDLQMLQTRVARAAEAGPTPC
jgi:hypothetical protein